tara:strand:+ start:274 stop:1059 length:786 start_codon:yes stop_codon:yes gene_type:complete
MIYTKKSLGQNFLIDDNIKRKIINLVDIENRNIIEIGAGKGSLTDEILKNNPKSLLIIEKDRLLAQFLKKKYQKLDFIETHCADILKFKLERKVKRDSIILGNLPYNISSQILVKILKFRIWPPKFSDLVFMFQKELGEKILGKFPSKNYSRMSILSGYRLNIFSKFLVSPNCFFPKPKVDSIVIHFKPIKKNNYKIKNINNLEKVTSVIFSNKRKMINKSIKKIISIDKIKKISNLNLKLRPDKLSPEIYYEITKIFETQ